MYLFGDSKLWWRTKYIDIQEGQLRIDTWDDLKNKMKSQFYPARWNLKCLPQMGIVREYVKQLSQLMLDVRDMSEKDKLFSFISGLKPWAQVELNHQVLWDLEATIKEAERSIDFNQTDGRKNLTKKDAQPTRSVSTQANANNFSKRKN